MQGVISKLCALMELDDCVDALSVSPKEIIAAGSLSGQLAISKESCRPAFSFEVQSGVLALAWSPDGTILLSAEESGDIKLFDSAGYHWATWHLASPVEHVAWINKEEVVAAAGRRLYFLTTTGDPSYVELPCHIATVFVRGDTIYIGGHGGVWSFSRETHEITMHLPHNAPVLSLAVSSDEQWVAAGDYSKGVHLWNLTNKEERHSAGYDLKVEAIDFVGKKHDLVIANWGQLAIWHLRDNDPLAELSPRRIQGHSHRITHIRSHEDGLFATGAADGSICVWDIDSEQLVLYAALAESEIRSLRWSHAGEKLYVATAAGRVSCLILDSKRD